MNPSQKLKELGIRPEEGQNFLQNKHIIKALVEAAEINEEKTVEIGGGLGAITSHILDETDDLTVVEKNIRLANHLKSEFSEAEIVQQDFMDFDVSDFERCIGNIPFNLSSEIIEKLGKKQVMSALIVQDEYADKIVADPGDSDYSYRTAISNYYFLPVKLRTVDSRNFYPEPEVDAAILKLYPNKDRHGVQDEEQFLETVKALFNHSRKKLRNAVVDSRHILGYEKETLREVRDEIPHSETRVNQLDIKALVEVSEFIHKL